VRPAGVPQQVSGRATVRAAELKRKLGDAWWVLQILWRSRDKRGLTHVTNNGLAHARGCTTKHIEHVRRAVKKLKTAGLLKPIGWKLLPVPKGKELVKTWVYVRAVFGAPAEAAMLEDAMAYVPTATAAWLKKANGRGGARPGSGPAKGCASPNPSGKIKPAMTRDQAEDAMFGLDGVKAPHWVRTRVTSSNPPDPTSSKPTRPQFKTDPTPPVQNRPADLSSLSSYSSGLLDSLPSVENAGARPSVAAPEEIPSRESEEAGDRFDAHLLSTPKGTEDGAPTSEADGPALEQKGGACALPTPNPPSGVPAGLPARLGATLVDGGTVRRRPAYGLTDSMPGVPPVPWNLVPLAQTPHPPLLVAEMSDEERAHALASAYRGATEKHFKRNTSWAFRKGALSQSKFYKTLVDGAARLLELEIAPAAWASWSCDVWKAYHGKSEPPPVSWVFGSKRIMEDRGWFEREHGSYSGGRDVVGPKRKWLMQTYMRMRLAIQDAEAWDNPQPFVDRYFPGTAYAKAVDAAKAEVAETTAKMRRDVDAGVFLW
jgi:hypothetical protein